MENNVNSEAKSSLSALETYCHSLNVRLSVQKTLSYCTVSTTRESGYRNDLGPTCPRPSTGPLVDLRGKPFSEPLTIFYHGSAILRSNRTRDLLIPVFSELQYLFT